MKTWTTCRTTSSQFDSSSRLSGTLSYFLYCTRFLRASQHWTFAQRCTSSNNNNHCGEERLRGLFRHFAVVYLAWPHATLVGQVFADFQISVFGHKFMRHQFSLWTEAAEGTASIEGAGGSCWGVRWNPLNPKLVIANQQASAHSFCMNCRQRLTLKCSRPLFKVPKNQKPNPQNRKLCGWNQALGLQDRSCYTSLSLSLFSLSLSVLHIVNSGE